MTSIYRAVSGQVEPLLLQGHRRSLFPSLGQPIACEIPIVQTLTAAGLEPLGAGVLFHPLCQR